MKSKSALLLLTGIAIGAMGNFLFRPVNVRTRRRIELSKKSRKYQKAFKETASKYKQKLGPL